MVVEIISTSKNTTLTKLDRFDEKNEGKIYLSSIFCIKCEESEQQPEIFN